MSWWKKLLERLRGIIDKIIGRDKPEPEPGPEPLPEPDPEPLPDPVMPDPPVSGKGKKYVYKMDMDIEEADGLMAFMFEGGKIEGRLFVVGREEDFSAPRGQTLLVSGIIEGVVSRDGDDITGRIGGDKEMKPVPYRLASYELGYAVDNAKVEASGSGLLMADYRMIDKVSLKGSGKGSYASMAKNVVCRGKGVLVEVLDVELEDEKPEPEKPADVIVVSEYYGGEDLRFSELIVDDHELVMESHSESGVKLQAWPGSQGLPGWPESRVIPTTYAMVCCFEEQPDGTWKGGKFDWWRPNGAFRDFKNIHNGYKGWRVPSRGARIAFVLVSCDYRRRTNMVFSEWK